MSKPLNFSKLDENMSKHANKSNIGRWRSREENPTIQMSLRLKASEYEQFRELCTEERRTNGEMIKLMMEEYLKQRGT